MAKKNTKKEGNSLNLESILFNCRDYLRGSASLNDKRDIILTLVFLRFIGEKFDDAQADMRKLCIDRGITDEDKIAKFLNSPSRYKNIVYVPEAARWSMLINVPASDLVAALDDALQAIEDSGDVLKGCVRLSLFTSVKIEPNELKKVVDEVNKISHKTFGEEKDLIGRVYEYFLKSFAVNATKEDGEFYTPHDIVELIAAFIEPFDGTLYDPCCGSGGMFIQCAKYVKAKQGDITAVNVFGQEKEPSTFRLAKMNLCNSVGVEYNPYMTIRNDSIPFIDDIRLTDSLSELLSPERYYCPEDEVAANLDETRLLDLSVESKKLEKRMALGEALPQLGVGALYGYNNFMNKGSMNGAVFAILQIPISDWGKTSRKMQRIDYQLQKSENEREYLQTQLVLQVHKLWMDLTAAWEKLQVAEETAATAEAVERQMYDHYLAGMVTISELLQTQTQLTDARNQVLDGKIAYQTALTAYLDKTGNKR